MEEPDSGLKLLERVKGIQPLTEVLLVTAFATVEHAVAAMKAGAADFLVKPVNLGHLVEKVRAVLRIRADREALERERERSSYLQQEINERFNDGEIVGRSPRMQDLYARIPKVAETPSSVLVTGESGTGKELVARAIHRLASRRDGPFVARQLRGARRGGARERAVRPRAGRLHRRRAPATGALRAGRRRHALPRRDRRDRPIDPGEAAAGAAGARASSASAARRRCTSTSASSRPRTSDLRAGGRRRGDSARTSTTGSTSIPLELPPLRDRREDIPLLCDHFLDRLSRQMGRSRPILQEGALKLLQQYDWPGNVRELENVLERAFVLCEGGTIRIEDLPFGKAPGGRDRMAAAGGRAAAGSGGTP